MHKYPRHLILVASTFHYRSRLPPQWAVLLGVKFLKRSLHTGKLKEAKGKSGKTRPPIVNQDTSM